MENVIVELKKHLEGKKVLAVNVTPQRDAICEFVTEDASFTLSATDLGVWISNIRDKNRYYKEVADMFNAIFEHHNTEHDINDEDMFEAIDNCYNRTLGFKCKKCSTEFIIPLTMVKESEYAEFFKIIETRNKVAKVLGETFILSPKFLREYLDA